jgi:hypothetical protein
MTREDLINSILNEVCYNLSDGGASLDLKNNPEHIKLLNEILEKKERQLLKEESMFTEAETIITLICRYYRMSGGKREKFAQLIKNDVKLKEFYNSARQNFNTRNPSGIKTEEPIVEWYLSTVTQLLQKGFQLNYEIKPLGTSQSTTSEKWQTFGGDSTSVSKADLSGKVDVQSKKISKGISLKGPESQIADMSPTNLKAISLVALEKCTDVNALEAKLIKCVDDLKRDAYSVTRANFRSGSGKTLADARKSSQLVDKFETYKNIQFDAIIADLKSKGQSFEKNDLKKMDANELNKLIRSKIDRKKSLNDYSEASKTALDREPTGKFRVIDAGIPLKNVLNDLESVIQNFEEVFNSGFENPNFSKYFVHESMSATVKFQGNKEYQAGSVLVISGKFNVLEFSDITDVNSELIGKISRQLNPHTKVSHDKVVATLNARMKGSGDFWQPVMNIQLSIKEKSKSLNEYINKNRHVLMEGVGDTFEKIKSYIVAKMKEIFEKIKQWSIEAINKIKSLSKAGIKYLLDYFLFDIEPVHMNNNGIVDFTKV